MTWEGDKLLRQRVSLVDGAEIGAPGEETKRESYGSPVVYASTFKVQGEGNKTATDNGQDIDREIPFLKEYTVFNAEQCEGLPKHFSTVVPTAGLAEPPRETLDRIEEAEQVFANTTPTFVMGGVEPTTPSAPTTYRCHHS